MASQPPEVFLPRPGFLSRARNAWGAFVGDVPAARPVDLNPVAGASPQADGAEVPKGTFSRAYGGFSIDARWLKQLALNDDTILAREGQHDLKLYDAILDDDIAASAFQQRRLAVISRPWEVEAGDDSAQAQAAADHLRAQIKAIGWDGICDKMLYGRWYGYAVAECLYEVGEDGKIWLQDIIVPDRRSFAFTNSGELRLRSVESGEGEVLPSNKFWAFRTGGSHDFTPYGVGLAHWCYWPVWFKKNVLKFWSVYLEKFGMPTTMGTFPAGADDDVISRTLAAAQAVASDRAIAKPDNVEIELLADGRASGDSYEQFIGEMNDALLRVILSQTGTSKSEAQGLGGSQSDVMKDVRDEVVRSDSDMLHESFNRTVARWLTAWNFGPNVAAPTVYRNLEDQENLDSIVERDVKLKTLGWKRTEESARETYGEGYEPTETEEEKAAREELMAGARGVEGNRGGNVVDIASARKVKAAEFAAMEPKPLFVSRNLLPASGRKLLAWARSAGIPNLYPLDQLHVTVLYSKAPVDWFELAGYGWADSELRLSAGGPRLVRKLGEETIALQFHSWELTGRHNEMVEKGGSHDFPEYLVHISVGTSAEFEVDGVEPYVGELHFGPEIFEEIEEDWKARLENAAFSVDDLDAVDRWTRQLASETDPILVEFAASLQGRLGKGIKDANQLRLVLLQALENFPAERLGELAAIPYVAARASAEAGVEA